jgi:hypothetical protein
MLQAACSAVRVSLLPRGVLACPLLSVECHLGQERFTNDPASGRSRALAQTCHQMRTIADWLGLLSRARESMLRTADEYDRLATQAEERLKAK